MTYLQEKTFDTPGLHTHIVKTEKFKTVTILFKMLAPLSKDDVTMRSLFPHVLLRGTEKCRKRESFVLISTSSMGRPFPQTWRKR